MSDIELKPCPFCGGSEKYPPYAADMRIPEVISYVAVVCGNCGAMAGSEQTIQQAEERWNDRRGMNYE